MDNIWFQEGKIEKGENKERGDRQANKYTKNSRNQIDTHEREREREG